MLDAQSHAGEKLVPCQHDEKQAKLSTTLQVSDRLTQQRLHYSFVPHERRRFVVPDSFDVSVQGWPVGTPSMNLLSSCSSPNVVSMYVSHPSDL
jgi:hypothetical protein